MIQEIAFLGNYGREYQNTRHNVAWLFADSVDFLTKLSYRKEFKADYASCDFDFAARALCGADFSLPQNVPNKIHFLKPLTYMNLSGEAVGEVAHFFKIPAEQILIVHDEIELPFGTISLKYGGGLGGHNGLRSVKSILQTADFWRLRFGVGKPSDGNVADYVLGSFFADEKIALSQIFSVATEPFCKLIFSRDGKHLLSEWGKKKIEVA